MSVLPRPLVIAAAVIFTLSLVTELLLTEWSKALADATVVILALDWLAMHERLRDNGWTAAGAER